MNYRDPRLRRLLAGEYVLGTLASRAHRRFARLLAADRGLEREVRSWERRLSALGTALAPVPPRDAVWQALRRRAGLEEPRPTAPNPWRLWAVLATAASVILGMRLLQQSVAEPKVIVVEHEVAPPTFVGLLKPEGNTYWTVTLTAQRITMTSAGTPPLGADKDFELWWIADAGPVSLGVLPREGLSTRALPPGLAVGAGGQLAVSIEPLGGSPTRQPTGPVIATTEVLQAG